MNFVQNTDALTVKLNELLRFSELLWHSFFLDL